MITITRRTARQVRAVFRRALGLTRGFGPAVSFHAGPDGLRIRARQDDAAVEYYEPGDHEPQEIIVPFEFLADCEGSESQRVQLQRDGKSHIVATWNDGDIPQTVRYDAGDTVDTFPSPPEVMSANERRLLTALHDAAETASRDAVRYALNCLQLRGEQGKIAATDGHQLLVQGGFDFPWDDDVLIPARKVFASRELDSAEPVEVGKSDDWVCFRVGPWTLHFKIEKESRFPRVEDHVPDVNSAVTTLHLSDTDAMFLSKSIKRLPSSGDYNSPVTVDLNGTVAIRAKSEEQSSPTELILTNSSQSGEVIRFNTNREFLARAMKLGFRDVRFTGPEAPAFCCDSSRQYLWALLGKDGAIKPSKNTVRIESPQVGENRSRSQSNHKENQHQMTTNRISQSDGSSNGRHSNNGSNGSNESISVDSLIETAEAVKAALRESTSQVLELITALKRHRKQSKTLHSALSSIRALQAIDA